MFEGAGFADGARTGRADARVARAAPLPTAWAKRTTAPPSASSSTARITSAQKSFLFTAVDSPSSYASVGASRPPAEGSWVGE